MEYPAHGPVRVRNERRQQGVFVSPSGVRRIGLGHTLHSRTLRLKALAAKVAAQGIVRTEAQVAALERQKSADEAHGEIETEHFGYLGSQDTYYVGTIKSIGRLYPQTFVDPYRKAAAGKRYTTKTPITAADLVNDRVLPMLEDNGIDWLGILTDRGSEFCGRPERHDYQCTRSSRTCRPIETPGSTSTTTNAHIRVRCVAVELLCRRCQMDASCGR